MNSLTHYTQQLNCLQLRIDSRYMYLEAKKAKFHVYNSSGNRTG